MRVADWWQKSDKERTASKPVRRLVDSIAFLQLCIIFALIATIAYAGKTMNRSAVKSEVALIDSALSRAVAKVDGEQKSVALWDDAVQALMPGKINHEWLKTEIGDYLYNTFGHQVIFILDEKNNPVAAFVLGKEADVKIYARYKSAIQPMIDDIRNKTFKRYLRSDGQYIRSHQRFEFLKMGKTDRSAGNLLTVNHQPVIVNAMKILPIKNMALLPDEPYILVSVVNIDQSIMNRIGEVLLLPDLTLLPENQQAETSGVYPFVTDDGMSAGKFSWTARTPGNLLLFLVLPIVIIAAAAAVATTRSLFRRLTKASRELEEREQKATYQALHDQLSGLPNRRSFTSSIEKGMNYCKANGKLLCLAYIDIDHFKDVNDTLGHRMGDKLISAVGARLKSSLRPGDVLARFGGDEFAALRMIDPSENPAAFGKELNRAFALPIDMFEQSLRVTGSIGLAVIDDFNLTVSDVMRHADIALYRAKDNGRACYALFTQEMAQSIEDRRLIETDLQKAVAAGTLNMVYQPLIDCVSNKIKGVEALVRWSHPKRGPISPGVFIPIAESTGLMPALGEWVLEKVFSDACKWPTLEVAVNLSPAQIRHLNLVPVLKGLLQKYPVAAQRIVLEITEGVLLEQTETTAATLRQITDLGFKLALDDFGTGYSSLSYLRQFRFDKIKIDQSFVQGATEESQAIKIVRAVTELGKSLNMSVVAEGIESAFEAELMINAGCNELQGYYFSRPVQGAAIDAFFAVPATEVDLDVRKMQKF